MPGNHISKSLDPESRMNTHSILNKYLVLVDLILRIEPVVDLVVLHAAPTSVPRTQTRLVLEYCLRSDV